MNSKEYFVLNPECILVKGALRGAIYDLNSGNVFSIDKTSTKILERLSCGENLSQILKDIRINQGKVLDYLNNLESQRLGRWEDVSTKKEMTAPSNLDKILRHTLHLELTTGCNLRCLHCYNESETSKLYNNNGVFLNDWQKVIDEAYQIGCRRVQFIGGEPFLKRELLYRLIPYAHKNGYTSLEVSTNGTLITKKDSDLLKRHNTRLAFSFYSWKPEIHDLITTRKGSWGKTLQAIQLTLKMAIPLRVSVVGMKQNKKEIEETVNFLKFLGVKYVKSTAVEPSGRGCDINLVDYDIVNKQVFSNPYFAKINKNIFWRNKAGHNCFSEQICIGADGNVYPCLAERKISYGSIKLVSFTEIFLSEKARRFKGLSKDNIEICRDCEYRYCCFDCRVRAGDSLENDSHCKPWWCSYNPYKGIWEDKKIYLKGGEERWKITQN